MAVIEKIDRYPGIVPFSIFEKDVFYGRDEDSQQLYSLITSNKQVLLYFQIGFGQKLAYKCRFATPNFGKSEQRVSKNSLFGVPGVEQALHTTPLNNRIFHFCARNCQKTKAFGYSYFV
jgi:hypothetical protein